MNKVVKYILRLMTKIGAGISIKVAFRIWINLLTWGWL